MLEEQGLPWSYLLVKVNQKVFWGKKMQNECPSYAFSSSTHSLLTYQSWERLRQVSTSRVLSLCLPHDIPAALQVIRIWKTLQHRTHLKKVGSCEVRCCSLGSTSPHGNAVHGFLGWLSWASVPTLTAAMLPPNVDVLQRYSVTSAPGVCYLKN